MRVFVDTNVVLDFLLEQPNAQDSLAVVKLCAEDNDIEGGFAALSMPTLAYFLRKKHSPEEVRTILKTVKSMFYIVFLNENNMESALNDSSFKDFEDCLQYECAKNFDSDYIVTNNIKDFSFSSIQAIKPLDFVNKT